MTALELLSFINQVLFIALFVTAVVRAVRRPTVTNVDTALLFGSVALAVGFSQLARLVGVAGQPLVVGITVALISAAPLAMMRLVGDFRGQPFAVSAAGYLAYGIVVALGFGAIPVSTGLLELVLLAFFAIVGGYAGVAFARESQRTRGITRRRMALVAGGATLFITAIVVVLVGALVPSLTTAFGILAQVAALASAILLWLGFIPPAWVRSALREQDLRRFMDRSIRLTGLTDDRAVRLELQAAAADAFGANGASIGLADPDRPVLHYVQRATGAWVEYPSDMFVAGRAFTEDRSMVIPDAIREDPDHAATYREVGATTVLAAPIRGEERKLGVLVVYAGRDPIFAEEDLALLELLADQLGVLLDARALARQVAEVRAREETARMKEEFLSSAAHDLRSPLTVVLGQAELLERRVTRQPDQPVDAAGVGRMAREARRLRDLVNDLLDAQRLEQGALALNRAPADLGAIIDELDAREQDDGHGIELVRPRVAMVGLLDRPRIQQVISNLVENARKYGPQGTDPRVVVETLPGAARIAVIDRGIGIPESERERIFERFYRATNAQRVTDTGLGLGLYICRRIVEEHGGRIWHEPTPGGGSTFVIHLPLDDGSDGSDPERPGDEPAPALEPGILHPLPAEARADA